MDRDRVIAQMLMALEHYAEGTDPQPAKEVLEMWEQLIDEILSRGE